MKKKLIFLIIPVATLLVCCIGVLCFMLVNSNTEEIYLRQINQAEKLLSQGNYVEAITHYKDAIETDKTKEDAYIALANIYTDYGDITNARIVLEWGIANVKDSASLQTALRLLPIDNDDEMQEMDDNSDKGNNKDKKGSINTYLAEIYTGYNYKRYIEHYSIKNDSFLSGVYTVEFVGIDGTFSFENTDEHDLVDEKTGKPYDGAKPKSISLSSLDELIVGVDQGVTADDIKNIGASSVRVKDDKKLGFKVMTFEFKKLKFTIECNENGSIKADSPYNLIEPEASDDENAKISFSGTIVNAVTGQSVNSGQISFRQGKNVKSGTEELVVEIEDGQYTADLETGEYTAEVKVDGFNTEYYNIYIDDSSSTKENNFSVSPALSAGEIRVVLEWGETPRDLDSHLVGTASDDTYVHVYYAHKEDKDSSDNVIANLDLDDTSGFGPETTTIYDTNGNYTFRVHNFSGGGSLANSGATVKIYTSGSTQPTVVKVPSSVNGVWWDVFTIEDGAIKNISGEVDG